MNVALSRTDRAGELIQESAPEMSPSETITMRSDDIEAVYRTLWEDRLQTADNLLPILTSSNARTASAANYTFNYSIGHSYYGAGAGDRSNIRCYRVHIDPLGKSSSGGDGGITWTEARIRAFYRPHPTGQDLIAGLYEESMDPAFESITMPARKLYWDIAQAEPLARDEAPRRLQQLIRWSYTIKGMPSLPQDLLSYQDHVNSSAMISHTYNQTFPAGTVLFRAPHIIPSIDMRGSSLFDITMEFIVKPEGATTGTWNKQYKAATAALQIVYNSAGTAFERYESKDLSDLLLFYQGFRD